MSNSQNQVREIMWQLIEKHYSVDRKQPQILIAKELIIGSNPIDKIADDVYILIERLIEAAKAPPPQESDDNISWGYYDYNND